MSERHYMEKAIHVQCTEDISDLSSITSSILHQPLPLLSLHSLPLQAPLLPFSLRPRFLRLPPLSRPLPPLPSPPHCHSLSCHWPRRGTWSEVVHDPAWPDSGICTSCQRTVWLTCEPPTPTGRLGGRTMSYERVGRELEITTYVNATVFAMSYVCKYLHGSVPTI